MKSKIVALLVLFAASCLSFMGNAMPETGSTSKTYVAKARTALGTVRVVKEEVKRHALATFSPCSDGCHDEYLSVYYQVYWTEYMRTGSSVLADDRATTTATVVETVCLYECRRQGFSPPSP